MILVNLSSFWLPASDWLQWFIGELESEGESHVNN